MGLENLNVSGVPLEWDASINTNNLEAGVTSIEQNLNQLITAFEKAGASTDNINISGQVAQNSKALALFVDKLKEIDANSPFAKLFTQFSDLYQQQVNLQDLLSKAANPESAKTLTDELQKVETELKKVGEEILNIPPLPDDTPVLEKNINAQTRLLQIRREMQNLAVTPGGRATEEFAKLSEEAEKLNHAIRNTNQELRHSDTKALSAIGQGVRGLIGGFQALSGAIALFGGDSKQAEEATKAVIGAMGILNGLQEITALLSKSSALNFYLEGLAHKANATAIKDEAISTVALAEAKAASLVTTEGIVAATGAQAAATGAATGAQIGLNAAMLANPVGAIIVALIALYGAYQVYIHTLGKATDEERRRALAKEVELEVFNKSIDTVAKEQATLEKLLITAKSDISTRQQKDAAITELSAKYPEYLGRLTAENVLTSKGADLIKNQIALIKQKALVAAGEDVYGESLKKQIAIQQELDEVLRTGETTLKQRISTFGQEVEFHGAFADRTAAVVKNLQEQLEETTEKSNAVFNSLTNSSNKLSELYNDPNKKLEILTATLDRFIDRMPAFNGAIAAALKGQKDLQNQQFKIGPDVNDQLLEQQKAFNKEAHEAKYKLLLAQADREITLAKNSSKAQQDIAAANKARILLEEKQTGEFRFRNNEEANSQILTAEAEFNAEMESLDADARARAFKANSDAAQATLLQLETQGKQESDAYYVAKVRALRAAAAEAINLAKFNGAEQQRINAQLQLDLENLEIEHIKRRLERERAAIQTRIALAKQGSKEEFDARISDIAKDLEIQLQVLGQSTEVRKQLEAEAAREISDLRRKFAIDELSKEIEYQQSKLNSRLSLVEKGSKEEFDISSQLIDAKRDKDILAAQEAIDSEAHKQAKITEIMNRAFADRKKLSDDFFAKQLQEQFAAIDSASQRQIQESNKIINDPTTTDNTKFEEKIRIINIGISDTQKKIQDADFQLISQEGDAVALGVTLDALRIKLQGLQNDQSNVIKTEELARITNIATQISALGSAFANVASSVRGLDSDLSEVINTLSGIASGAAAGIKSLSDFRKAQKSDDSLGQLTAGLGVASSIVSVGMMVIKVLQDARDTRIAAEKEVEAFNLRQQSGQIDYNIELRKTELIKVAINKLSLDAIRDQKILLEQQKQANRLEEENLLKKLQNEQFISGEKTKKGRGSLLFGLVGSVLGIGAKTSVEQELSSLVGKTFEEMEKLFATGQLTEKASALFQQLQKLKQEGVDIESQLAAAKKAADELFTGTTAESIVDSIADGFSQGFKSVKDFATKTEDIIRGALLSAMKTQALEGPIKKLFEQFAEDAEDQGGLDIEEVASFTASINKTIEDASKFMSEIEKATGVSLAVATSNQNSLQGSLKAQLTEQTGSVIAGHFNGLRLTSIQQLNIATRALDVHNKIQLNTLATANSTADLVKLIKMVTEGDRIKVA